MLKVSEVYEKQVQTCKENPDGSEYTHFGNIMDTRESLLNRDYIISVSPHEFTSSLASSKAHGAFPEGTKFSSIILDGNSFRKSQMIVVGSFDKFCRQLEDSPQ